MKNERSLNLCRVFIRLALCLFITIIYCETLHAQELPQRPRMASLIINFDEKGTGNIGLSVMPEPSSDLRLEQVLAEALGVSLNEVQIYTKEIIKARLAEDPELAAEYEYTDEELNGDAIDFGYSLTATFTTTASGSSQDLRINLEPLVRAIRTVEIEWLDLTFMHPLVGRTHCEGIDWTASTAQFEFAYHSLRINVNNPAQAELSIKYGFGPADDLARLIISIALIFLVPVTMTLWMRRRALELYRSDPTAAWFRFFRSQNYIVHLTWLVWLAALPALDLLRSLSFVLRGVSPVIKQVIDVGFYFLIPAIVTVVCNVLFHSVHSRIRGEEWTRRDLMQQAIWANAVGALPFLCAVVGIGVMTSGYTRLGILCMLTGLATLIVASKYFWKSQDLEPHSLSVGELRDRIFALAEKAGVKLKQIYILPGGKGRMMNAFAAPGNKVMLTHYLLKNLSRREVDAVIAHEIAHLKHNHTSKRSMIFAASFFVCLLLTIYLEPLAPGFPFYSVCIAASLVGFHHFTRRHEYEADHEGAALAGDPEAMVTALTKLARVSHMPVEWSRFDEAMLTHPSTMNRAKAIAQAGGIGDERLQELLQPSEIEEGGYSLPPSITSDEKIFSTSLKNSVNQIFTLTLIAATTVTPALAAWFSMAADWSEPVRLGILLFGFAATLALVAIAINYMAATGCRKMQRQFRSRLEREGVNPDDFAGVFVGLSPAPEQRLYENNFDWDVGFLLFAGDDLFYIGEQARFSLRKNQISGIRLGEGPACWFRSERIYISWSDNRTGAAGVFNIHPNDVKCLTEVKERVRGVYEQLRLWMEKRSWPVTPPATYAELRAPNIGPVTSAAPSEVIGTEQFVMSLVIMLVIAFLIAILFGLSFSLSGGVGWYVLLVAMLMSAFQRIPYWLNGESAEARATAIPEEQAAH